MTYPSAAGGERADGRTTPGMQVAGGEQPHGAPVDVGGVRPEGRHAVDATGIHSQQDALVDAERKSM